MTGSLLGLGLLQGRLMSSVLITLLLLLLLLHPSVQFTLVHRPTTQRRQTVGPASLPDEDAVSSPGKLVTHDNHTPILQQAHHHQHLRHQPPPLLQPPAPPSSPSTDSTHTPLPLLAHTRRRPANSSEKTNRGEENFRPSHGFGETPALQSLLLLRRRDEADAEGSSSSSRVEVKGKKTKREESGGVKDSQQHLHQQVAVENEAKPSSARRQLQQQQQQNHGLSDQPQQLGSSLHNQRDSAFFTQVVQVDSDLNGRAAEKSQLYHTDKAGLLLRENAGDVTNREAHSVESVGSHQAAAAALEGGGGKQQLLQQQQAVAQRTADQPHVSKMVLTAVGSLTAIVGVCVMAAIFQCCCRRRKRSSSSPEGRASSAGGGGEGEVVEGEEGEKEGLNQKKSGGGSGGGSGKGSARTSRSPSPQKGVSKEEENQAEKGQSEKDSLLGESRKDEQQQQEDNDLGDFSMVQRETSILRSYRKPPPPKNRARASRVPRVLKAVDPNTSPAVLKELVNNEEKDTTPTTTTTTTTTPSDTPQKTTNGLTSSDIMSPDMQSSMLADIDSTLAAMHNNTTTSSSSQGGPSPPKSAERSRETSVEKLTPGGASDSAQLKAPAKPSVQASSSREQLAKALAQELTRSASKEMLAKPQSKTPTPKSSKETTPKSQSAGASPKTAHGKNLSGASSKDSVGGGSSGEGTASSGGDSRKGGGMVVPSSPEEGGDKDKKRPGNIFTLIDPTAKGGDKAEEAGGRSKIPVRAASSPTQPTAPLRLSAGKDKRFPVPSVHGDQMDQLMKSLKTRLKEDDGDSSKKVSNTTSPQEDPSAQEEEDLDPMGRDRSHSDPTKLAEDKGKKLHQTHL